VILIWNSLQVIESWITVGKIDGNKSGETYLLWHHYIVLILLFADCPLSNSIIELVASTPSKICFILFHSDAIINIFYISV
jgi:hypothetical protein